MNDLLMMLSGKHIPLRRKPKWRFNGLNTAA